MSQGSSSPTADIKRLGGNAIATGAGATNTGTLRVQLSDESLSALENISITVPGTVDLGSVSLTALETITVEQSDHTKFKNTAKITDGTNLATVKAASTAAVAGDTALVVAISPNNTVAATQSGTWNISNISGTVSLPTGAATSAKQDTLIGHVDGIETLLTSIEGDTTAIQTAVQLLDDAVATDGSGAVTKLLQVGGTDGTNAQILSTNASGHLNIADGGNSITVDGTVAVSGTVAVTDNNGSLTVDGTVAATQSGTWTVALDSASLSALESITVVDGGASLTVDGTVAATQSGTWNVGTLTSITNAVSVTDNSGSLTVDAPVGTPVYVRLSNGSSAVDTLPVSFTAAAKSNASTTAYAASLVIKASAGTLYMINGYNSSTSDQWIQIHDAASLPADGSAPKLTFLAPAESNFYFDFGMYGRAFTSGIVVCNSSTGPTKAIGAANCWFDAQFA